MILFATVLFCCFVICRIYFLRRLIFLFCFTLVACDNGNVLVCQVGEACNTQSGSSSSGGPALDLSPDAFSFAALAQAELSELYRTAPFTVTGINTETSIKVSGGRYAIDDGNFTDVEGTVVAGQTVVLELVSAAEYGRSLAVELSIGDVSSAWTVSTRAQDITPDALVFEVMADKQPNSWIESNTIVLTGFDASVSLSVTNGEYSINGGDFTRGATRISAGATLTVRHLSPPSLETVSETEVLVGSMSTTFRSITQAGNSLPVWRQSLESVSAQHFSVTADGASTLIAADLDGDGDKDLLSASVEQSRIAWYKNISDDGPAVTARTLAVDTGGASSLAVGDLDGDGNLDVLSASPDSSAIVWYQNNGAEEPEFAPKDIDRQAAGASSAALADVDGDGDLDVFVGVDG